MSIPSIRIEPNSISGTSMVAINGNPCGEIWMTDRGCCYKHTNRDLILSTDMTEMLVSIMRGVESLQNGSGDSGN